MVEICLLLSNPQPIGSSLHFAGLMKSALNKWTSVNELMKSALILMHQGQPTLVIDL